MSVEKQLAAFIRSIFAPKPDISVTEWAEQNVILPASVTQNSGQYSTARCAYIRELLEDFRNPDVSYSSNCFAAQTFKTSGVFVGLAYRLDQQPASMIVVLPTYKQAGEFSKDKWQPMIEASPVLKGHKQTAKDKFTITHQQFDNCTLHFIGSGSESNLKGKSAQILVIDEIDDVEEKWSKQAKSGVSMLESRTKSFSGKKIIKTGTPKEVTGAIWKAFLDGDRRLYFVDCPRCKAKPDSKPFVIEFSPEHTKEWFPDVLAAKVVWDGKQADGTYNLETVRKSAALECPCCKTRLGQEELPDMVAAGRWIATNPKAASGKPSRRLPTMYSPHEDSTLGNLAVKWLECKSSPGERRNFINEQLALPFVQKASTATESDIRAVVASSLSLSSPGKPYVRGTIPIDNIALLSLTVDVNADFLSWVIRAWYGDSSSSLVDYGSLLPNWKELEAISKRTYTIGSTGREIQPMCCLIDSGWRTKSENGVYDFCLATSNRFRPIKGSGLGRGLHKTIEQGTVQHRGRNIELVQFDDNTLKHELYFNKIKNRVDANWFLPSNIGPDYEEQLTDEYLRYEKGKAKWDTKHDNNHLGDCEKYQLIVPTLMEMTVGKEGLKALASLFKPKLTTALS